MRPNLRDILSRVDRNLASEATPERPDFGPGVAQGASKQGIGCPRPSGGKKRVLGHPGSRNAKTSTVKTGSWRFWRDKCDRMLSEFVRARDIRRNGGMCMICGRRPVQVCFHFLPRGNLSTRWEPDNCCGACSACNYGEMMRRGRASSDERFREAHVGMVGEGRRRALEEMSRLTVKRSADDLRVLYDELKARRERVALDFDRRQR